MKLLAILFVPIFCLELGTMASSDSLIEAFSELLNVAMNGRKTSIDIIFTQYNDVLADINDELYNNILPTLNQTNYDIQDYITKLNSELTSTGYNLTDCMDLVEESFRNVSSIAWITNVTAKAIEEKEKVYENILYNVYLIGINNIHTVSLETNSIYYELITCANSDYVQYCNTTVLNKVVAKQEEILKLYRKHMEIGKMNLIQQGLAYKNRVEDYVNEVIKTAKPYLDLLEICAQKTLSYGQ